MKIGLCQINPTVGDLDGNLQKIIRNIQKAEREKCDLVLFPEMTLTGYPPEDLLLKPAFVQENLRALKKLALVVRTSTVVLGFVDQQKKNLFNAAAWMEKGKIKSIYHKQQLPNYGVFDEVRYFRPGSQFMVQTLQGHRIGLTICEDIWMGGQSLSGLKKLKPNLVINISASPFHTGKLTLRHDVAKKAARYLKSPLIYCNMIGGQDELVFDGGSFAVDQTGKIRAQFPLFEEDVFTLELGSRRAPFPISMGMKNETRRSQKALSPIEQIFSALTLGLRDYVEKNGFQKVAIGLSGGIDSALVAALATEALGPERVTGITMPSRFNLDETKKDAEILAKNLGIKFLSIPIQNIFETTLKTLSPQFQSTQPNIAEENLQARIRGNLMMALSNKFNWLVLTTGNKSETSTGYCTLYGDTAGGFAVLKDVLKTTVYELSRFINKRANRDIIPQSTIERPPTAELKENQKDEDSLGAYADLDPIIVGYVEKNLSPEELSQKIPGKKDYVRKIVSLIDRSEYKRRQAPPGIKITPRSFGRDHRMPITNRFQIH